MGSPGFNNNGGLLSRQSYRQSLTFGLHEEGGDHACGGVGQPLSEGVGVWVVSSAGHNGGGEGTAHDVGGVEQLRRGNHL